MRFVDPQLSTEMAQYVVMHVLLQHRHQRDFDAAQAQSKWAQRMLPRKTADTRIGILGLGEIGTVAGERLRDLGFPVHGWSRTRKSVSGIKSYAGESEFDAFLKASDFLVCLLPLTNETRGMLNAKTFATLPGGAYVINVARGGHLVEADLIASAGLGTSELARRSMSSRPSRCPRAARSGSIPRSSPRRISPRSPTRA